ncbi:ABC transporter ATP-binding protein [Promethearchaeum syntrophicum]|uniref:ABC transporter ATP-binding protein n=1 Tax=Promethearchaeum syntrophicum TaxID=2594042 RepID=A0A5B9D8W0_9ARCH|nr:ABC transporter ATP-binding protein [Candidatus Prometheoarchaeum syntrophicum]QEE15451.1 putative branched-chain amino acid transport ATP-binding protein LivG [Candidatus Prometheoarchaeum syntrophicum]
MNKLEAIRVDKLVKYYKSRKKVVKAVDDISFSVLKGERFGFLGPNGAGKTTTIRAILGLLRGVEGEIAILGKKINPNKDTAYRNHIGYIPGELGLDPELNAIEICKYLSKLYDISFDLDEILKIAKRLKLDVSRPIQVLSKGNKQKVGILTAFMGDFELLILDEPTAGLDPLIQAEFFDILKEKQEKTNCTIFICSHILSEVENNCHRVAIIRNGKIVEISDISELKQKGLKSFQLEFASNDGLIEFSKYLQSECPNASIKSQSYTNIEILIPPDKKRLLLNIISEKKWAGEFIKDFNINNSSLEEIFMKYYDVDNTQKLEERSE